MLGRWPYDEASAPPRGLSSPSWECPEGHCQCHPVQRSEEESEVEIVLRDLNLERMRNAVCYVEAPALVGDSIVDADGEGTIRLQFWRMPRSIILNWAPRDLPPGPPWPLRKVYYVDLRDDEELALARRLHNLGFSGKPSLEENICEFERSYGYPMTGDSDRVRAALIAHHDGASDPGELDTESAGALAFDEPEIPLGDVDPIGYFPEWYRPPTIGDPIHDGFLCRLQGTVQQHEAVAKRIYSTPRSLTGDDEQPLMASSAALLMTSYLYDERYRQADWIIEAETNRVKARDDDDFAAMNYGWHTSNTSIVNPRGHRQHCVQHHVDYSQLLYLVAGVCRIQEKDGTKFWTRTYKVYTNTVKPTKAENDAKEYYRLAHESTKPLPDYRYRKFGQFKA